MGSQLDSFVDELCLLQEAGAYASAISLEKTAKPYAWMGRSELLAERKQLQDSYFKSSKGAVGAGAIGGAFLGGVPMAIVAKKTTNEALKKVLKRSAIPTAVVGSLLLASAAPDLRRNKILKDLSRVDKRLGVTTKTGIRKQLRKRASEEGGHWRELPAHWKGEDKQGNPSYGKTWVDREEAAKEEAPKAAPKKTEKKVEGPPTPEFWRSEGPFQLYVIRPNKGAAFVFAVHESLEKRWAELTAKPDWSQDPKTLQFMKEAEKAGAFGIFRMG